MRGRGVFRVFWPQVVHKEWQRLIRRHRAPTDAQFVAMETYLGAVFAFDGDTTGRRGLFWL